MKVVRRLVLTLFVSGLALAESDLSVEAPNVEAPSVGAPTAPVSITSFSPPAAAVGQVVTLFGRNFQNIGKVFLNGVQVPPKNISSPSSESGTRLSFVIPTGAITGFLKLQSRSGAIVRSSVPLKIEPFCAPNIESARVLAINHINVVNNDFTVFKPNDLANSRWSFPYLMGRIGGFNSDQSNSKNFELLTSQFISRWLWTFCAARGPEEACNSAIRVSNGNVVAGRDARFLLNNWPKKVLTLSDGSRRTILDLNKAPFRLLSIMSRIDLRNQTQAGEGRFVFGVTDPDGNPLQFTVILEYKLPLVSSNLNTSNTLEDWADRWAALSNVREGSPEHIRALKNVTNAFSDARFQGLPNSSALNQLRTNELTLGFPWQLREWNLGLVDPTSNSFALVPATVKQTPDESFNNTQELANWVFENRFGILDGTLVVKNSDAISVHDSPRPLLGAFSNVSGQWILPDNRVDEDLRRTFAVNMTCNGCHSSETRTSFTHVAPRSANQRASFSLFLKADLEQRKSDLSNVLIEVFCK